MHQPFVEISDSGVNIAHSQPARHVSRKHDYKRRPVNVALHHNLTLENLLERKGKTSQLQEIRDVANMVNIIAVREQDKDKPEFKKLLKAYHSAEVKAFVTKEFKDSIVPAW